MKCADVMTRNPTTCETSATVQAAALIMSEEDVGIVPVVEPKTQRLVGVVTDRDLCLDVVASGKNPTFMLVSDSLHTDPITCRQEDDLDLCLEKMRTWQVHRIPVVNEDGRCVGIISQKDIALRVTQPKKVYDTVREISKPSEMPTA